MKWINLKSKKPNPGNSYLFLDEDGNREVCHVDTDYNLLTCCDEIDIDDKTHWMRIPDNPKF